MASNLNELIDAFPRLMRGRPPRLPGYVGPGWHGLVMDVLRRIDALLDDAEADAFSVDQIKEKFGRLQIYVSMAGHADLYGDFHTPGGVMRVTVPVSSSDTPRPDKLKTINEVIAEATARSLLTCEECGSPGTLRPGGWMRTLCDHHEAARRQARRDGEH
ncbi:MAG: hypothetical protein RLZZ598_1286 [Pseudomonadota bacterium]|jgi:hypothetical protein